MTLFGFYWISRNGTEFSWIFNGFRRFVVFMVHLVSCRFVKVSPGWNGSFGVLLGFAECYLVVIDCYRRAFLKLR